MSKRIRIGTRGSPLALWQAGEAARRLLVAGYEAEIVVVQTTGDRHSGIPLASIGGKGLFIKELEEALEAGEIDVAVHSLKDVPSIIPAAFVLAGFLERADPRDAWVHPRGRPIAGLAAGSVIGTSAPRRRAQLAQLFPLLRVEEIRGNVDTRLSRAREGRYDGLVLANAGLTRLGRSDEITSLFSIEEMLPAAGQGIVALECRTADEFARAAAASVDHEPSHLAADCERGVLQKFGERLDCSSAVAVHATAADASMTIRAFASDLEGARTVRVRHSSAHATQAIHEAIHAVYEELVAQGAEELLCPSRKAE